jgi:hypothetical protein
MQEHDRPREREEGERERGRSRRREGGEGREGKEESRESRRATATPTTTTTQGRGKNGRGRRQGRRDMVPKRLPKFFSQDRHAVLDRFFTSGGIFKWHIFESMESITGKRQNTKMSRARWGKGKDQKKNVSGSPRREGEGEREQDPLRDKQRIKGQNKGSKQQPANNNVGEALRADRAKGADAIVSNGALEPGPSSPGIVKGANA